VEKEELAAWLVILKEFQCGWRGALRLHLIGALKNRSTVSWFICLFVCIVSNTMYFYTQKINRVVITPGSQAVYCIYIYIYMHTLFTAGRVDLYMGIYILIYMFIDHRDTSVV
jgi:hypothetical protein